MKTETIRTYVENSLSESRWTHTRGVISLAETLLETYETLPSSLPEAALLHDNARNLPVKKQRELAESFRGNLLTMEVNHPGLLHAPAGAMRMVEDLKYEADDPVVQAVNYHSTGHPSLNSCLKGLLLADFAEPNRSYDEAGRLRRRIGQDSLDELVKSVINHKIRRCLEKNLPLHPDSVKLYNSLCE